MDPELGLSGRPRWLGVYWLIAIVVLGLLVQGKVR